MDGEPKNEAASEGLRHRSEQVWQSALEHVDQVLAERLRLQGIENPTTENIIIALLAMMAEYGATKDGTNVPVNNDNRHIVEAIAHRLRVTEALHQLELVQGPTTI